MFGQSNFQKLLQTNPTISKKASQLQTAAGESTTPKRHYTKAKDVKFSSMSKKLDTTKVEQLRQLGKLTAINENGTAPAKATKRDRTASKILGDAGLRVDRSAPAKALYIPDIQTPKEKAEAQRQQQQNLKQIQKQETHIKNYIDNEWWYTKKHNIHVPPLHDPLVMVHHYALGPKNSTVFDMATVDTDYRDDRDYQHVLVRVAILTKYGQVIYDKLVQPMEKITDYRTNITGVTREDFQIDYNTMKKIQDSKRNKANDQPQTIFMNPKVAALRDVRVQVAEIIENRILIGYLLASSPELNELEKQALIQKFSVGSGKRTMNAAQQKELMEDYKTEQTLKNKNYLLDLLQVSHPLYLVRDFAHGKIIKLDEFLLNKFILPSLNGFIHSLQQKHGLTSTGGTVGVKKVVETTKGNLVKDNFLSLSRPLDFVSLDTLLNNAMATYQLYLILKNQWEALFKATHAIHLSQYRVKILELTKAIEERKEMNAFNKAQEDEKQKRRDNWNAKQAEKLGLSIGGGDDDDDSSDDDDSDSDDSDDGRW